MAEVKKPIPDPLAPPGNTSITKQSPNHKQDSVQSELLGRLLSSDCGILKPETSAKTLRSNLLMEAAVASETSIYFHQTIRLHIIRRQPSSPMFLHRISICWVILMAVYYLNSCLSVRMGQLGSHSTNFHVIWHLGIFFFENLLGKIQVSTKIWQENPYFTWSPKYFYGNISVNTS